VMIGLSISNKGSTFDLSIHQRILKKQLYQGFHKNIDSWC